MPKALRLKLLEEAAVPNDFHITKSHGCALRKIRSNESENWLCFKGKTGLCLSSMEPGNKVQNVQGWKCEKEELCKKEANFAICVKCMNVETLTECLPYMLGSGLDLLQIR